MGTFNFWNTPEGRALEGLPPLPPALWVPVYQATQMISQPDNKGGMASQPINPQYLLSMASAGYLATLYGATLSSAAFEGAGGIEQSTAVEYRLNWIGVNNGKQIPYSMNAGALAYYYKPAGPLSDPNGVDNTLPPGTPGSGVAAPGAVTNPSIVVAECYAAMSAAWLSASQAAK